MKIKRKDLLAGIAVALGPILLKLLASTLKIKILEPDFSKVSTEARIYAFWHGKMLVPMFVHRDQDVAVLISEHRDGEMIAKIITKFGSNSVRGSSTRGAMKAYVGMLRQIRKGVSVAFTPDGPQGPKHIFKQGAMMLSVNTGKDLYLANWYTDRKCQFSSWDSFEFPKPFANVVFAYERLPALQETDDLEAMAVKLQERFQYLEKRCHDALHSS